MPVTVSTLDDFDRADASTLGPNWHPIAVFGFRQIWISGGNVYTPVGVGSASEFWTPEQFGPDCEIRFGIEPSLYTDEIVFLYARGQSSDYLGLPFEDWAPPWNLDSGYRAVFNDVSSSIERMETTGNTSIASEFMPAFWPDDVGGVALRCEGDTISTLVRPSAGGWETVCTATDTTWPDAGYLGFGLSTDGTAIGTGTEAGDEPVAPPTTLAAWGILAR